MSGKYESLVIHRILFSVATVFPLIVALKEPSFLFGEFKVTSNVIVYSSPGLNL